MEYGGKAAAFEDMKSGGFAIALQRRPRRGWWSHSGEAAFARYELRRNNSDTLLPPNPKVFDRTFVIRIGRGVWGM